MRKIRRQFWGIMILVAVIATILVLPVYAEDESYYLTVESIENAMLDNGNIYDGAMANQYGTPFVVLKPGNYVIDDDIDLNQLKLEGISLVDGNYCFSGKGSITGYTGYRQYGAVDLNTKSGTKVQFNDFILNSFEIDRLGDVIFNKGSYTNVRIKCDCEVLDGEFYGVLFGDITTIKQGDFYKGVSFSPDSFSGEGDVFIHNINVISGGMYIGGFCDAIIYNGTVNGGIDASQARMLTVYDGEFVNDEFYAVIGPETGFGLYIYDGKFEGKNGAVYSMNAGEWYDELPMKIHGGTFAGGTEGAIVWNRTDIFSSGLEGKEVYNLIQAECFMKNSVKSKEIKIDSSYVYVLYEVSGKEVKIGKHNKVVDKGVGATCNEPGVTEGSHCSVCGEILKAQETVDALGHKAELQGVKDATCEENGYTGDEVCAVCKEVVEKGKEIPKKDHIWDEGVLITSPTAVKPGVMTYICTVCNNTKTESVPYEGAVVERIWGKSRYITSLAIADTLKEELNVDKFNAMIIANGQNFPDALAGSYLAAKKNAPILMVNGETANITLVRNYIEKNLVAKGKVYILGGSIAVPESIESSLKDKGYAVERLKGKDRYATNLAILQEAGVLNEDILVCTGTNFADSLSASAVGLPMLLVNPNGNSLTEGQEYFLNGTNGQIMIIGGTGAVSEDFVKALSEYDKDGKVERVKGKSRYETSVEVAKRFCKNPSEAVIAYAVNFPDGLCGGPLAFVKKAPLILTAKNSDDVAAKYVADMKIKNGTALGGSGVLPEITVKNVFGMDNNEEIIGIRYE